MIEIIISQSDDGRWYWRYIDHETQSTVHGTADGYPAYADAVADVIPAISRCGITL